MSDSDATAARIGLHPFARVVAVAFGLLVAVPIIGGGTYAVANALVRTTETDRVQLDGAVESVTIDVDGSVTVEAGAGTGARVRRSSTFGLRRPKVEVAVTDGVLQVRVRCQAAVICTNDLDVEVPPTADVLVRSGDATLRDVAGRVRVESQGGGVRLERVAGDVDVDLGGGEVDGIDLRSRRVRVAAAAGHVNVAFAEPPDDVDVRLSAGSIVVAVPPGEETYRVEASTGTGDARTLVARDPDSLRILRAHAAAGDIEIRYAT